MCSGGTLTLRELSPIGAGIFEPPFQSVRTAPLSVANNFWRQQGSRSQARRLHDDAGALADGGQAGTGGIAPVSFLSQKCIDKVAELLGATRLSEKGSWAATQQANAGDPDYETDPPLFPLGFGLRY
jgi:hypothetical protein